MDAKKLNNRNMVSDGNKLDGIVNPMLYKGGITLNSDFPTSAEVQSGWTYTILADVVDNDVSKTNTGQSFLQNAEIAWNGSNWTSLGYSAVKSVAGKTGIVILDSSDVGLGNVDNKSEATIITDVKSDGDVSDAISKKHTQNADTLLVPVSSLANQTGQGLIINVTFGETVAIGDPLYIASDGKYYIADANGVGKYPVDAISLVAGSGTGNVLLYGIIRNDSWTGWTVGGLIYLSTSSGLTQTAPVATNDVIQVLGRAIASKIILFKPSSDYITHL